MKTPAKIPLSRDNHAVAQWIWNNLVPKSGQCDTVQGELLRAVEKLSWEAQNNGNVNWDSGFEMLIDYLESTLCGEPEITDEMKRSVRKDLKVLRRYRRPYTEEDLYDRLMGAVVAYCRLYPKLLAKPLNPLLKR